MLTETDKQGPEEQVKVQIWEDVKISNPDLAQNQDWLSTMFVSVL